MYLITQQTSTHEQRPSAYPDFLEGTLEGLEVVGTLEGLEVVGTLVGVEVVGDLVGALKEGDKVGRREGWAVVGGVGRLVVGLRVGAILEDCALVH